MKAAGVFGVVWCQRDGGELALEGERDSRKKSTLGGRVSGSEQPSPEPPPSVRTRHP